ncbi:MAG: hypothetical protein EZS28_008318 [Streblomastix strix]|uniref:Pyridoxamine 5'-phosphate oxidase putative domain-containing protein n=1 Tax=Streblomastix strix TaxID=222440 RepID=A0A5J4WMQ5_9EUKA|nr:MAG: hypothetical protein EZS28_008318 [Streblomastix strix]
MATEAEKFLLTLKDQFPCIILTTSNGLRPATRYVQLRHSTQFYFFITTMSNSSKVAQIEKNAFATLSIYPDKGYSMQISGPSTVLKCQIVYALDLTEFLAENQNSLDDALEQIWLENKNKFEYIKPPLTDLFQLPSVQFF